MPKKPILNRPRPAAARPVERPRAPRSFMVVGVGASAGGLEAFQLLLRSLASDINAALVFVCHLSPDHESTLGEIFQRETKLTVQTVHEATPILPGHIYVLPPDRQLRLIGGVLRPEQRPPHDAQRRPIDVFLQSLAVDQGNCAVGVLLSGNGADGAAGLQEIKSEGGITFAQTEASANFPSMPAAAMATGAVDFNLTPQAIATELRRIARHPVVCRIKPERPEIGALDGDSDLQRIFALLRALNGVDFSFYKHTTLKRRILRRMMLRRIESMAEYVAYLQKNPAEVDLLFHDLLINVTSFFRDPPVFTALRKKIFPKLIAKKRAGPLRVWVPGCSTGEEVYSLAISLFEYLGKNPDGRALQIFATDISETALSKARAGFYPHAIEEHVAPERLRRFFQKTEGGYVISKAIRDCCVFARQNLIEDPPFSNLDLISCRNVLIYLGPALQKKVIPIFHYALKPTGQLLLGGSETIGLFADLFTLADKKNKIYLKRPRVGRPEIEFFPKRADPSDAGQAAPAAPKNFENDGGLDLSRLVDRVLLTKYSANGIVVNARLQVVHFRGQTGAYLEHSPGDASLSLLKLLRHDLLVDVRSAVTRAIKLETVVRKDDVEFTQAGRTRRVNLEVVPFKNSHQPERYYLIIFSEVEPAASAGKGDGAAAPRTASESNRDIIRMREELLTTKESLQAIIEEQEATNEELKSANEENQSSNEELQSTNEELETAKEELQSTNEELTTLNEELQTRNGELTLLNNDLRNLLSSVSVPILMLGHDLTIRRFTPMAERFFNLIPTDVGRRISDINPNLQIGNLAECVTEVIDTLKIHEHDVQDRQGRWYSLRIRPYRTTDNKIDGAVVLLVDIDEIKRALDEFMFLVKQPLLSLRTDLRVHKANDSFYAAFGIKRKESENCLIYDLDEGSWRSPALKNLLENLLPEKERVENFKWEYDFGERGRKPVIITARRLYQQSKATQITLLAFEINGPN